MPARLQVSLSTDLISGFCGETEEDHRQTLDLVRSTGFDQAFMFAYSQRDRTHAARHLQVPVRETTSSQHTVTIHYSTL